MAAFDLEVKVPATGLAWSPDGRHLATGLGGCRVWTLGSTEPQFISQRAEQISWSGDGSELASSEGSYIAVWEEGSWSSTQTVSDASYPVLGLGMLTWDPQDHFLVAGGSIGPNGPYLLVWSPRNWELEQVIPLSSLASLTASPQGDLVAASTYDGRVRIWDTTDWREMPGIEPGCWNVNTLAFSPDGKTLATGDDCGKIKFWQMPPAISSRQVGPWLASPQGFPVASLAWSPDGTLIAAGLGNWQRNLVPVHPAAAIWDVVSGEMLNSIMGESPDDGSVAWSPDGTKLAVAGYVPNTIQILGVP